MAHILHGEYRARRHGQFFGRRGLLGRCGLSSGRVVISATGRCKEKQSAVVESWFQDSDSPTWCNA